jgi:hypothetical protein
MNQKIIFKIENRGYLWIYHWMVYILGGLRHIINGTPTYRIVDSEWEILYYQKINITYPIKIYIPFIKQKYENYHLESLALLSDKFEIIFDLKEYPNYKVIDNYGEPLLSLEKNLEIPKHVDPNAHKFIRELFLKKEYEFNPKKYVFLLRHVTKNTAPDGIVRRRIINEEEIINLLKPLNFEFVDLATLNFEEKIKLFNTSSIILSPQSGGLVFSIFANNKTNIIEICPTNSYQYCDQYKDICTALNINFFRYQKFRYQDYHSNMDIDTTNLIDIINIVQSIN